MSSDVYIFVSVFSGITASCMDRFANFFIVPKKFIQK